MPLPVSNEAIKEADSDVEIGGVEESEDVGRAHLKTSENRGSPCKQRKLSQMGNVAIMKWLLAVLVFCILSWVCAWTIMAAHTDAARKVIYPALASTYFDQKSGAKVFTYLGVFYMVAGAVTLSFLCVGVRLPRPTMTMVRSFRFPFTTDYWTVLEIGALVLFLLVQGMTIMTRILKKFDTDWDKSQLWYEVTKTLGKTAALTLMVLFLPISKSCFWWDLFNIKFERSVKFHRFLGWFLALVVVVHAASAITSLTIAGQFKNCMWPSENCEKPGGWGTYQSLITSRIITYGWFAALVCLPLIITSLPWFRRNKFEWFYYTHFLFVPAMILMHMHYDQLIYYTAPGLTAYVLDKVLWWCSSRRAVKLISLTTPAPGFVRMVIALDPSHTFEPGQWVQIKVPTISMFQWHPMSVASSPDDRSTITIDVKVMGDWSMRLQSLATRFDPTRCAHTCVFVDQFHGSSHGQMQGYLSHPAVLIFAGGIGITPMMSFLRQFARSGGLSFPALRRVVLVWVVKKESVVDLYRDELSQFQTLGTMQSGCELDVIVHATLSEKEDANQHVSIEMEAPSREGSSASCDHGPFMQHVMGYSHKLILTVSAGGGYLLGLFLANFLAYDQDWLAEYIALLQLCLAILFAGALSVVGMSGTFFRPTPPWSQREQEVYDSDVCTEPSLGESLTHNSSSEDEASGQKEQPTVVIGRQRPIHREQRGLHVVLGCRPNVEEIVSDMKDWCLENKCSSAGVAVCGPEKLTESVMKTCKDASSSSLHFIVDHETFEW